MNLKRKFERSIDCSLANTFDLNLKWNSKFLVFYIIIVNKTYDFFLFVIKIHSRYVECEREILIGKKNSFSLKNVYKILIITRQTHKEDSFHPQKHMEMFVYWFRFDGLLNDCHRRLSSSSDDRVCIAFTVLICLRDKYLLRFIDWLLWLERVIFIFFLREGYSAYGIGCGVKVTLYGGCE